MVTNLYPIGTIIQKKFNGGIFYEGAITSYYSINNLCKVKFMNGDREECTYEEVWNHCKTTQMYTKPKKTKSTTCGPPRKFNNAAMFIPTKKNLNPVKQDYNTKKLSILDTSTT